LIGIVVFLAVVFAIQFVPVKQENPATRAGFEAPVRVKEILQRSCYDCHSNQTRWPWYSRVAPVSWIVAWDVSEAREEMNFSEWGRLGPERQVEMMAEIWEEVEEGEMPLWYYLPAHPDARLSSGDREILRAWSKQGRQ
jgi:hypothetical protein